MESGQPHATHRPPSSPEEPHSTIACGTDFSVHARTGWNIIMQPHLNHPARAQDSSRTSPSTTAQLEHAPPFSRSLSGIRRLRSDESWIEVSSQPSSSSLSSTGADDANTNGQRVYYDQHGRRRRRLKRNEPLPPGVPVRRLSAANSSQEEYEESESESDRIMTSSNEALEHHTLEDTSPPVPTSSLCEETSSTNAEDEEANDDENSTALGFLTNEPVFTPQPNAFSHPPQQHNARHPRSVEERTSYFPTSRTSPHRRPAAHSYPSRARISHTPYNVIAPSHTPDHDAALRASLSTLLSCAAAARGLPKRESSSTQHGPIRQSNRIESSSLRLVPESAITGEVSPPVLPPRLSVRHRTSATSLSGNENGKRKASASKERHRDSRSKKRRANSPFWDPNVPQISPTLLTWVVSAGVVVLFSAISFSAGYAIGKEVGRVETGAMNGKDGIVCGKEVGKGLRRLRWGANSVSVIRV